MKRTQILMIKTCLLGLSVLEINKTVMYVLWWDHVNPNNLEEIVDTDSFLV